MYQKGILPRNFSSQLLDAFPSTLARSKDSAPPSVSRTRKVSPSGRMQFRIDVTASVRFCKRAPRALYALTNSTCSAPFVGSSARDARPDLFVFCRIRNREAAVHLIKVYLLAARTVGSANVAYIGFCELRLSRFLRTSS
jgi:hypothetical protein